MVGDVPQAEHDSQLTFSPTVTEDEGNVQPRCLECGYVLRGLSQARCPECGQSFDPADPTTFSWRPVFMRWKYWFPGLVLAGAGGAATLALFIVVGSFGAGLVIALPLAIGSILGYGVRVRPLVLIIGGLGLLAGMIMGLISGQLAGLFCGLILAASLAGPLLIGMLFGWVLRIQVRKTRFKQRFYLPMIALIILPGVVAGLEWCLGSPAPIEVVSTSRLMPFSAREVWDSLMFYEEVTHDPPALARIGLPRPLRTTGQIRGVGDIKVCVYDKGRLAKRVTVYEPGAYLGFDVVEQVGIEDRSVALLEGGFRIEALGPGRSRLTLTTVYQPLLAARWYWRPLEYAVAHSLHEHVLTGIELEAQRRRTLAWAGVAGP